MIRLRPNVEGAIWVKGHDSLLEHGAYALDGMIGSSCGSFAPVSSQQYGEFAGLVKLAFNVGGHGALVAGTIRRCAHP